MGQYTIKNVSVIIASGVFGYLFVDDVTDHSIVVDRLYKIDGVHKPVIQSCVAMSQQTGAQYYTNTASYPVCACVSKFVLAEIPVQKHSAFNTAFAAHLLDEGLQTSMGGRVGEIMQTCSKRAYHRSRTLRSLYVNLKPLDASTQGDDEMRLRGATTKS